MKKLPKWLIAFVFNKTIKLQGEETMENLESWYFSNTSVAANSIRALIEVNIQSSVNTLIELEKKNLLEIPKQCKSCENLSFYDNYICGQNHKGFVDIDNDTCNNHCFREGKFWINGKEF